MIPSSYTNPSASFFSPKKLGSSIKHVLITEAVAQRKDKPIYFPRGQQLKFQSQIATEEEEWDSRLKNEKDKEGGGGDAKRDLRNDGPEVNTFEEFRWKNKAAGVI